MAASLSNRYRRIDLNGTLMIIATNLDPPWWFLKNPNDLTSQLYDGLSYPFLLFMAEYFNFKWKLIDQNDEWGIEQCSAQNSTGVVGSILSGRADFAMGGVSNSIQLCNNLTEATDFVQISRITYLTLKPESRFDPGVIFRPFDPITSYTIAITCLSMILLSIILQKITKIHFNLFWFVFQAFINQSIKYPTINWFGINFFIQLCWWYGLFLSETYSSVIISKLTDSQDYNIISNVQEFSKMTSQHRLIPILSEKSSYFHIFEQYKNEDKIFNILNKNLEKTDTYDEAIYKMIKHRYDIEFGVENFSKINKSPIYSVIGSFKFLNMFANRLGPQYFIYSDDIETAFFTDYYGLLFQTNSTMIPYFNRCIKIARDHGFFVKWFVLDKPIWNRNFPELISMLSRLNQNGKLGDASGNQLTRLTLHTTQYWFQTYFICLSSLFIIFIIEIIWKIANVFE